jgi:cysteine sulfinate desulfinase/cysteine desulfurase-like protein
MRSGTLPTHLVVGLGAAAQLCMDEMKVRRINHAFLDKKST